jgi:hypothetical protein
MELGLDYYKLRRELEPSFTRQPVLSLFKT